MTPRDRPDLRLTRASSLLIVSLLLRTASRQRRTGRCALLSLRRMPAPRPVRIVLRRTS